MSSPRHDGEPKQLVRIKLPKKLVAALDKMRDNYFRRDLYQTIELSLEYAFWKWSHGQGPEAELGGRWDIWDEAFPEDEELDRLATRFAQDDKQLERLLALGNPPDETAVTP